MMNFKGSFFCFFLCLILFSSCSKIKEDGIVKLSSDKIELRSSGGICNCVASVTNNTFPIGDWAIDVNYSNRTGAYTLTLDSDNTSGGFIPSGGIDVDYIAYVGAGSGSATFRIDCNGNDYNRNFSCTGQPGNPGSCNESWPLQISNTCIIEELF